MQKKRQPRYLFSRDMNINRFLEYYIEDNPGPIINHNQQVVGQHKGFIGTRLDNAEALGSFQYR